MSSKAPRKPTSRPHTDRYGGLRGSSHELGGPWNGAAPMSSTASTPEATSSSESSRVAVFRKVGLLNFLIPASERLYKQSGQRLGGVHRRDVVYATPDELGCYRPSSLKEVIQDYNQLQSDRLGSAARLMIHAKLTLHMPGEHAFDAGDRVVVIARLPAHNDARAKHMQDERNQLRSVLGLEAIDD